MIKDIQKKLETGIERNLEYLEKLNKLIILSFGSNLKSNIGNRKQNIEFAYRELKNKVKVIKKSAFYETNSYPNKNNPKFINTVAIVETILDEFKLLQVLLKIEKKLVELGI